MHDLSDLICKAGQVCFLFSADVARAQSQLPIDLADRPVVCFAFEGSYYTNVSLPLGLCWVAAHCQVTSMITRKLTKQGTNVLSYIDDFG